MRSRSPATNSHIASETAKATSAPASRSAHAPSREEGRAASTAIVRMASPEGASSSSTGGASAGEGAGGRSSIVTGPEGAARAVGRGRATGSVRGRGSGPGGRPGGAAASSERAAPVSGRRASCSRPSAPGPGRDGVRPSRSIRTGPPRRSRSVMRRPRSSAHEPSGIGRRPRFAEDRRIGHPRRRLVGGMPGRWVHVSLYTRDAEGWTALPAGPLHGHKEGPEISTRALHGSRPQVPPEVRGAPNGRPDPTARAGAGRGARTAMTNRSPNPWSFRSRSPRLATDVDGGREPDGAIQCTFPPPRRGLTIPEWRRAPSPPRITHPPGADA